MWTEGWARGIAFPRDRDLGRVWRLKRCLRLRPGCTRGLGGEVTWARRRGHVG